jgi:hypothetical protein
MLRLLVVIVLAAVLPAQSSETPSSDPLGRTTPQNAIFQFLEACHAHAYAKAAYYLDLRQMSPADREKKGPRLARQLEDLLDDTPFEAKLPQVLVTNEILDTPLWRWIALLAIGFALWFAAGLVSRAMVLAFRRFMNADVGAFRGPARLSGNNRFSRCDGARADVHFATVVY